MSDAKAKAKKASALQKDQLKTYYTTSMPSTPSGQKRSRSRKDDAVLKKQLTKEQKHSPVASSIKQQQQIKLKRSSESKPIRKASLVSQDRRETAPSQLTLTVPNLTLKETSSSLHLQTEPDGGVRLSQQRTLSKKKKQSQPGQTSELDRQDLQNHLRLLQQHSEEAIAEFKSQLQQESQEVVKQALSKIFYAKKEFI